MSTKAARANTKPLLDAFVVSGEGNTVIWTKIGGAWPHDDGKGFNVAITPGLAISGKVVLREPRPRADTTVK